jgi:hypothetical protein
VRAATPAPSARIPVRIIRFISTNSLALLLL